MQRPKPANTEKLDTDSITSTANRFAHDFSRIPLHAKTHSGILNKFEINTPEDISEQETERAADRVMRKSEPRLKGIGVRGERTHYRRCEQGNRRLERAEHAKTNEAAATEVLPIVEEETRSAPGVTLDVPTRKFMEARFGHDFSQVRVHTDANADAAACAVRARAFTLGCDIVFGSGQYAPNTDGGRRLLAHELAHVVQQAATATETPVIQRDCLDESIAFGLPVTQRQSGTTFRNFPNLMRGSCRILASGGNYNCYGWAAGVTQNIRTNHQIINFLMERHPNDYQSRVYRVQRSNEVTIEGLRALFQGAACPLTCAVGRSETADVLIYSNGSGPQHAARRSALTCAVLGEVMYESKMGSGPLLLHLARELEGGSYGNISHNCTYLSACTNQPSIPSPVYHHPLTSQDAGPPTLPGGVEVPE